jgi:hypothetical protein
LSICRSKRRRDSREVIEEIIAATLVIRAELWKEKRRIRADDARAPDGMGLTTMDSYKMENCRVWR